MTDLDDFFAKKDRKKSKSTKKFATTDEVAKKLEDTAKKSEKVKKDRPTLEGDESTGNQVHDQDEWKDFEEEKKDYSGLKIGNLTINATSDGNVGSVEQNSEQQQGAEESGPDFDRKQGPWKRMDAGEVSVVEEPVRVVEKRPEQPVKSSPQVGGAYKPPNMRGQQQPQAQTTRLRSKAAPDIHNEEFFPTLSKTGDHKKNRSDGMFEVVQHNRTGTYRNPEQSKVQSEHGPKLSLENRYNTLSDS